MSFLTSLEDSLDLSLSLEAGSRSARQDSIPKIVFQFLASQSEDLGQSLGDGSSEEQTLFKISLSQ